MILFNKGQEKEKSVKKCQTGKNGFTGGGCGDRIGGVEREGRETFPKPNKKAPKPRKLQDLAGRMPGQAKWSAKECVTIHCERTINGICFPEEKGWKTKLKEARNGRVCRGISEGDDGS